MTSMEQKNINILSRTDTKAVNNFNAHRITLICGRSFTALDSSGKTAEEFYASTRNKFGDRLVSVV